MTLTDMKITEYMGLRENSATTELFIYYLLNKLFDFIGMHDLCANFSYDDFFRKTHARLYMMWRMNLVFNEENAWFSTRLLKWETMTHCFLTLLQGVCVSMLTKRGGLIQSVEQSEDWFTGIVSEFYFLFWLLCDFQELSRVFKSPGRPLQNHNCWMSIVRMWNETS